MILETTRNLNHQIWSSFELFMDFTMSLEKENVKGLYLDGPKLRTERNLAGQLTGPGPTLRVHLLGVHVDGAFTGGRHPAGKADWPEAVST